MNMFHLQSCKFQEPDQNTIITCKDCSEVGSVGSVEIKLWT